MGVELVARTGRNPQNVFIQLGCSKMAENKMLHYVKTQCVGKPFSNMAMVRSLIWPRETDDTSFFCAELVASILRVGGLLDTHCNPGSATPEMLHRIYAPRAAVSANPCLLRELHHSSPSGTNGAFLGNITHSERLAERESLMTGTGSYPVSGGSMARHTAAALAPEPRMSLVPAHPLFQPARRRADSPPRGHFQVVSKQYAPAGSGGGACSSRCAAVGVQLTMNSLQFGGSSSGAKSRPR